MDFPGSSASTSAPPPLATVSKVSPRPQGHGPLEEAEEDEDSDSSSSSSMPPGLQLEKFRQMWKKEIAQKQTSDTPSSASPRDSSPSVVSLSARSSLAQDTRWNMAKQLYRTGSRLEKEGQLVCATEHYRQALKLEPEMDLYWNANERRKQDRKREQLTSESSVESDKGECCLLDDPSHLDDLEECADLMEKFNKIRSRGGLLSYCSQDESTEAQSLGLWDLPPEILVYIIRWVVGAHLDLKSLEEMGLVCRGFYLLSRDEKLWRRVCLRNWGVEGCDAVPQTIGFSSWREMALTRPRIAFNGVYISRTSYVRGGDPSVGSVHYRPYFMVEYYRALRFFPDGRLLYISSPDLPPVLVKCLADPSRNIQGLMQGYYCFEDRQVTCILHRQHESINQTVKRPRRGPVIHAPNEPSEYIYKMNFELKRSRSKPYHTLLWSYYAICTRYRNNAEESMTQFDLTPSKFPPFRYSRVKAYTDEIDDVPL